MTGVLTYLEENEPGNTLFPGPATTLSTTAKALYTSQYFPVLGANYFNRVGKGLRIVMFGKITTAATPGNGSFNVYYGSGADAAGVILMTGTAQALIAGQTDLSWRVELNITCRSTGLAGTLLCTGMAKFNEAVSVAMMMLPASAPAVSGACDLTAANIISVQFLRSGSTAETMQMTDMEVTAIG